MFYIYKFNSWIRYYSTTYFENVIRETTDGFIGAGYESNLSFFDKYDSNGSILWRKLYSIPYLRSLQVTNNNEYIIASSFYGSNNDLDMLVMKLDSREILYGKKAMV